MLKTTDTQKNNQLESAQSSCNKAKSYTELKKESKPIKRRLRESQNIEPREGVPIAQKDTDSCVALWQSIVVQAIYDLVGEGGGNHRQQARAEALAWFGESANARDGRQSDFEMVCDMANLNPQQVRECARKCRKEGIKMLDGFNFRSLRKNSSIRKGRKV